MNQVVICRRDIDDIALISRLEAIGITVTVVDHCDVAIAMEPPSLEIDLGSIPIFEPPIIERRDFGKRGKKRKRNKDWHRR